MSVLVYIDYCETNIKKSTLEALSYGAALAKQLNTAAEAVLLGTVKGDVSVVGKYGITRLYHANSEAFNTYDAGTISKSLLEVAQQADVIVFAHSALGSAVAPAISAMLKAGLVSGAVALPETANSFVVKKSVFSGKAYAKVKINTDKKIITLKANSFGIHENESVSVEIVNLNTAAQPSKIKTISVEKVEGEVPLTEAEIVVSGGRGLKGPENWHLITGLAHALHGAIACSRPVSDDGWRPHHEHVGQTGVQIAPNLYIAIGISGAIQHLGGVNRSKTIVVINKDGDAPFFKAADYGIVGDAFEVVPKLIEAVKKIKS